MLRKKEFTSFDVAAAVLELKEAIANSHVSNVYQLDSKTLLFKLHKPGKPSLQLVLEARKRLHLTSYAIGKPLVPPAFCMALRKYLRNALLADVRQYQFERVVVFSFNLKAGTFRLVLELFGEGNIILVGEKGEILHALTYKRMRDRNILRGEPFAFAPSSEKNPFKIGKEEFWEELPNFAHVEVVRALARFLSIGGLYAEEVLLRAEVDKGTPCHVLTGAHVDAIFDNLQTLLFRVSSGKLEPCIVLDENGEFVDVLPIRLKYYESFKLQSYDSFNEALDEFYVRVEAAEKASAVADVEVEALKREADRLKRIVESQEKALVDADSKVEMDRRIGDAIYAHIGELQVLLDRFLTAKENGKMLDTIVPEVLADKNAGVKPWVFFESFDAKNLTVNVCVDGLRFALDLQGKLFDCAGRFYERAKRARQKLEGAKVALEETRKKLLEVEIKIREAEALKRVKPAEAVEERVKHKIKRKEWFEKFRWFISSDGFLVVAGKDAVSNEVLVKKHAESNDIVFHADVAGAPFVIVKTGGKEPNEQVLKEVAEFAASFSRGWREGFASVDVYWVKPDQLSKGGPSGEYMPRGAFVVSGKRNWMRNVSLEVAVGVVVNEESGEINFVNGPVDAVKTRAKVYVVIVPGEYSSKELFKHALKMLAVKLPKKYREKVLQASIEEIKEFIPYKKGRIVER